MKMKMPKKLPFLSSVMFKNRCQNRCYFFCKIQAEIKWSFYSENVTGLQAIVPDRVKPSFVICDIQPPGTLTLSLSIRVPDVKK